MRRSKITKTAVEKNSHRLKILFMTVYAAHASMRGGFRMYQELCNKFENEKVDVYSLVNSHAPTEAGKQLAFSCAEVFEPKRLWFYLTILKTIFNLRITISKIKPDVVIGPGLDRLNNIALLAIKLTTKTPVVMIFHHWNYGYSFIELLKDLRNSGRLWLLTVLEWWLTVLALRLSTLVITISSFSAQQLEKLGVKKEKIAITGAGIDCEEVEKALPAIERFDGVFVGAMEAKKGVFDLISIWEKVVKEKGDVKLAVIGAESPLKERWFNEIRRKNLEKNIAYLGNINDDKVVYGILKSAKVFIFPSHVEGFCIAVGEAMVAGLPVVCWDIPALKEVYGKSSAVEFVLEGRFEDFSKVVCCLLTDERFRLAISEAGRRYPLQFSWDNVAHKQLKIFEIIAAH